MTKNVRHSVPSIRIGDKSRRVGRDGSGGYVIAYSEEYFRRCHLKSGER